MVKLITEARRGQAQRARDVKPSKTDDELVLKWQREIATRLGMLPSSSTGDVRRVRREFSKRLSKASPDTVIQLVRALVRNAATPRFVAYELLLHHKEALASVDGTVLEELGKGISSWGEVDVFACYVAGPVWRARQIPDRLIIRWAKSADRWWRRAAIVSTVPLNNSNRGGTGDPQRTLMICNLVVHDRDEMVVKALSWALRELSKKDPKAVRNFLRVNQQSLASRVRREVNNKLSTGLKNPRKRGPTVKRSG